MLDQNEARRIRNLLWTWGRIDKQCADLLNDLRALKNMIDDTRGIRGSSGAGDGQPHGTGTSDPTANTVMTIEAIVEQFEKSAEETHKEIARLQALKRMLNNCIAVLYPVEQEVVRMKYKLGYKPVYIGIKLGCSERSVFRYDDASIEKISHYVSIWQET